MGVLGPTTHLVSHGGDGNDTSSLSTQPTNCQALNFQTAKYFQTIQKKKKEKGVRDSLRGFFFVKPFSSSSQPKQQHRDSLLTNNK